MELHVLMDIACVLLDGQDFYVKHVRVNIVALDCLYVNCPDRGVI